MLVADRNESKLGKVEFYNKVVLVTGATGLIGSHLVRALLDRDAQVIAMGRSREKLERVFSDEKDNKNLIFSEGNVANGLPDNLSGVDYIFHAASPISGAEIKEKPVDTIMVNLNGTVNCLQHMQRQGKGRLIVFSSATVYGNQLEEEMIVSEDDTARADALHTSNTPYSESKRMIEVLARAYSRQYGVDSVIVRIGYVYGYINPSPNTAFYEFINKAVKGENITLNNSGMGRRDNIHVDDVVRGLLAVAQKGVTGESYNISSNGDLHNFMAIDEIAQLIADSANELDNKDIDAIIKPMEGERKPGMKLDNKKTKSLGWNIQISIEDGIKDTVRKYIGR